MFRKINFLPLLGGIFWYLFWYLILVSKLGSNDFKFTSFIIRVDNRAPPVPSREQSLQISPLKRASWGAGAT